MPRRKEQKELSRARILDAAYRLFSRQGLAATTTLEVARRAKVSHGLVFAHFPTREALVTAVVAEFSERVVVRIHALVEARAALKDVLAAHLAGLAQHEAFYARLVTEGTSLPALARATLIGIQSATAHHIAEAAEREMETSRIRRMPIHLLFNTWLGLVHHYLVNRDLFAPGESVLERRGTELLEHYLYLLAPCIEERIEP
jgi:AcrR family transcriptional regulator